MPDDPDYGLLNEQRVLNELARRKLPFQHRVRVAEYEVDFLVGARLIIEVDGYVHALKEAVSRDASKEEHLRALGFMLLRITGVEARNRGFLREFGAKVQKLHESEAERHRPRRQARLKGPIPQDELRDLREKLHSQGPVAPPKKEPRPKKRTKEHTEEHLQLTDEQLFLEAIAKLTKRGKD